MPRSACHRELRRAQSDGPASTTWAFGYSSSPSVSIGNIFNTVRDEWVGDPVTRRSTRHLVALEREKRLVLRSIKELEFDKAMGKVADADFDDMAGRLRQRAVGLMQRIEQGETGLRERIANDLTAMTSRSSRSSRKVNAQQCLACQTLNDADARFCKSCGAQL